MYTPIFELDGIYEDVNSINEKIEELTGDKEPFFDTEGEGWRAWVEYKGGKTLILAEIARG